MISQNIRCIPYQINSILFLVYHNLMDAIDLIDFRNGQKLTRFSIDDFIITERLWTHGTIKVSSE